ncbi:MAG: glycoside hydrolase family 76 protein [Fimbriimonas sp.]|nr:glycoside hydrolase family 76 protein [Fimbriimonas sp.]
MILLAFLTLAGIPSVGQPNRFELEADRLTRLNVATFYDSAKKIWKPPVASSEAVGTDGYTFWTSLLAWQSVIEAAKVEPRQWKSKVGSFYGVLEQYFDRADHAYCAWKWFPGNDDRFYDDNTWAAIACLEAFDVTHEERYRSRGIEIFDGFVKGGWDGSDKPGGLRWGTKSAYDDRKDRTVSATAAGALAALLIAKSHDATTYRAWAKRALDWIHLKLSASNGLIYDGFSSPKFERMNTIWTYNTGVPIRAAVEYARQTGDKSYLEWAIKMGNGCLDRTQSPMFDGAVKDPSKRYWYDSTFFVQYLVDGMRSLSLATHDSRYIDEARREADYCMGFLRDEDGLYWRNMRLWTIDSATQAEFLKWTGQDAPTLAADESERSAADVKMPVEKRPMAKTLLANAGVARMLWLLAH